MISQSTNRTAPTGEVVRDTMLEKASEACKTNIPQNMSNKEKTAPRKLIRAKNTKIIIKNTDKNMGAADTEKGDVISEFIIQLSNIKTY